MIQLNNKEVRVRKLDIKKDERGWLAEILRKEELSGPQEFGQLFITVANVNAVKGNHYHNRKYECFCAIQGDGTFYIENNDSGARDEIPMGEKNMVCIFVPPNHTHAIKNTGTKPLLLLVYISETFNEGDPDTFKREII